MWDILLKEDLQVVLSQDELDKLENISTTNPMVIEKTLEMVCEFVRGCISAKGYKLSTKEHTIPNSYVLPALIVARCKLWTRFPNAKDFALDEVRISENEWALKCIQEASIDVSPIPWEDDEENPENPNYKPNPLQGSIKVPYMRFTQFPFGNSFNDEINKKY